MSIEDVANIIKARVRNNAKRKIMISLLKKHSPKDTSYYVFIFNKGTKEETRSRFLTFGEAIGLIKRMTD